MSMSMTENERNELNDISFLMSEKSGRRFMWRMLESAGIYRQSFAFDNAVTAFNEGQRSIGLMLLAKINLACPERYLDMQKEAKEFEENERTNRDAERSKQLDDGYAKP